MSRAARAAALVALGALAGAAGCGSREAPPAGGDTKVSPAETGRRSYPLTGVVRKVDRASGEVSIRHDEIPGFMPAMTMPFSLKGQEVLEDLQEGDKISGTLIVEGGESRLVDVNITELATAPPPDPNARPPGLLQPGDPVPDFTMTTQEGKSLRLSDLRGKVVALTFIYTRCPLPDYCPLMDRRFAELAELIRPNPERSEQMRLLSISFDPEHDTPEVLARHAELRGAKPPLWTFAVATHEELRRVAEPLGLAYGPRPGEIVHTLSTAVIDPQGRLVLLERGNAWKAGDLFRAMSSAAGHRPR